VLSAANFVLTALLVAGAAGVLAGGQIADRTSRHGPAVSAALLASAALAIFAGYVPLSAAAALVVFVAIGLLTGATRSSRDMMVRRITPERDVGKVFAYVSSGLNVGAAIAPFAFGLILDHADPAWIFVALAGFFLLGIATLGTSRMYARPAPMAGAAAD
jgi:MFS family permease